MINVTILVPVADNDGQTFAAPHHAQFEAALTSAFTGFTREPGLAVGGWVDAAGKAYRDLNTVYTVGVEGGLVGNEALREVLRFAKAHYRQEAIFIRYLGVSEVI